MVKKERNSSFELMRIISMLFIVLGHTLSWGGITSRTSGLTTYLIYIIYAVIVVHVNSFVLLTGYYQSNSKFRIIKVINLLFLMFFYRIILYTFCVLIGWCSFDGWYAFVFNLLPLSNFSYWFLNIYIVLYMIAPFLNRLIILLSKESYKILLIILFVFFAIIPRITLNTFIDNDAGYSLVHFIFMYLLGAYLRLFDADIKSKNTNKPFFYLLLFFGIAALKYIINFVGYRLMICSEVEFLKINGKYLSYSFENLVYDDPLVIIQSVFYFMFFKSIVIKSNIINFVARCVNEVYLIHMNLNIRSHIYLVFGLSMSHYTYRAIPMAFIISIILFSIGFVVYNIRTKSINYINRTLINKSKLKKIICKFDAIDKRINSI